MLKVQSILHDMFVEHMRQYIVGIIELMMVELIGCNLGHWDLQDFRQAIYPEALEMGESMEEPGSGSKGRLGMVHRCI